MSVDISTLRTHPSYFTWFLMGKLALNYARSSGTHSSTWCDETWRYSGAPTIELPRNCMSVSRFSLYLCDYERHAPVSMTSRWRKVTQQRMNDQPTSDTVSRSCENRSSNTSLFASSPSSSLFMHIFQLCDPCTVVLMRDYWFYPCVFIRCSLISAVQLSAYCQRWLRPGRKDGFISNPPSRRLHAAVIVFIIDQPTTRLSFHRYTSIYASLMLRWYSWYGYWFCY
jgi:hypothetical protein